MIEKNAVEGFVKLNTAPLVGEFDGSRAQGMKLMSSTVKNLVILLVKYPVIESIQAGTAARAQQQQQCSGSKQCIDTSGQHQIAAVEAVRDLSHDFFGKAHFFFATQDIPRVRYFFKVRINRTSSNTHTHTPADIQADRQADRLAA